VEVGSGEETGEAGQKGGGHVASRVEVGVGLGDRPAGGDAGAVGPADGVGHGEAEERVGGVGVVGDHAGGLVVGRVDGRGVADLVRLPDARQLVPQPGLLVGRQRVPLGLGQAAAVGGGDVAEAGGRAGGEVVAVGRAADGRLGVPHQVTLRVVVELERAIVDLAGEVGRGGDAVEVHVALEVADRGQAAPGPRV